MVLDAERFTKILLTIGFGTIRPFWLLPSPCAVKRPSVVVEGCATSDLI